LSESSEASHTVSREGSGLHFALRVIYMKHKFCFVCRKIFLYESNWSFSICVVWHKICAVGQKIWSYDTNRRLSICVSCQSICFLCNQTFKQPVKLTCRGKYMHRARRQNQQGLGTVKRVSTLEFNILSNFFNF
jgi:hypothetical protein